MHLLTQSKNFIFALELRRHLGVCYKTAWLVKHKLMEVMRLREEGRRLTGRVEIDDAYLGGERSGGKTGRGSENKVSVIAAVQTTEEGKAKLAWGERAVVPDPECAGYLGTYRPAPPYLPRRSLFDTPVSVRPIGDGPRYVTIVCACGACRHQIGRRLPDPNRGWLRKLVDAAMLRFFGYDRYIDN